MLELLRALGLLCLHTSLPPESHPRLNLTIDHRGLLISKQLQSLLTHNPFLQSTYKRRYIDHDARYLEINRSFTAPRFGVGDSMALEYLERVSCSFDAPFAVFFT
jgi:hypothetical protein